MSIVPAAQPMSRRVKALRLREPLMQRQMARRVERRKREDEAWARIEDEEQLLRSTNGRDRLQDGRDKMEENRKVHEEALDQDQALEEQLRQARVEERRRMMRQAAEGRPAAPTGRRRADNHVKEDDTQPAGARSRQAELYVRQRLARKVGGFADIVAMAANEDPVQRAGKEARTKSPGLTGVAGERDGVVRRRVLEEASSAGDEQWDF